jgi:hypothetical protein
MRSNVMTAAIAFLVGVVAAAGHPQSPTPPAAHSGAASVAVPQGNGVPVITDGIFTPGEWDDAQRVAVADGVTRSAERTSSATRRTPAARCRRT